jgi:PAS domain S-box-containing protein
MTIESPASELRKTGISAIGDVRWGTHFCYFYETKQDLLETLVLYFKEGLESKEFCVWVVSHVLSVEEAKQALGRAVPDLGRHLVEGTLEIHSHHEWYLRDRRWDSQRVLQKWRGKINHGSANGHMGLRAAGDGGWIQNENWMAFREYENQVSAMVANQRTIILCTYPLTTSPADLVFDVAHIHEVAVARRNGIWETIEIPALKQAKAAIRKLNEELEEKVEERTRELAAANEALKKQILERQELEQQARTLIDAIPHQIWSGPPDGTLDYCNERWRSYMGLEQEELCGDGWQRMLHPEDRDRVINAWHESVINGTPYEQEERHRGADGKYRWFLARGVPLRDAEGRIARWYGTNTDIEGRKRAEEALRRSEEKFKTLFGIAPVGISVLDQQLNVIDANPALERILRLSREELLGGTWRARAYLDATGTRKPREEMTSVQAVVEKRPFNDVETGIVTENGEIIWTQVSATPLDLPDTSAVVITQDITERKRAAEALEAANRQLRILSRQLFHIQEEERRHLARELHDEIGQTLTAAKINLKIIAPDVPAKVSCRLDDSIQLLDGLLRQVRQLSLDLRPPLLDELGLVPTLRWLVDQQAQRAGLRVTFTTNVNGLEIDPDVQTACFRVAQEAITNIIRHSGAKNVAVELRCEGERLTLSVRDDGAGFDPAVIQQRTHDFTLGLVSMKERALLVHGGLEVHSALGQGAEIRAWFPLPGGEHSSETKTA